MSETRTAQLVAAARAEARGVGAFNVITLEHAEGVLAGAERVGVGVILQLSENAVRFHGGNAGPLAMACAELARASSVPVALHLDHVTDAALLDHAADLPFSSVMFDAGALPHAENVERTRAACESAHRAGLYVEAELGYVGGKASQPQSAHAAGVRTDPAEATDYVQRTGVDALAVAVGSSHAMTSRTASIDAELVTRLAAAVPVPLVLHGSSGVPDDQLRAAVLAGMVKINIGTMLNIAMTGAVRRVLTADAELVDPRKYLAPARDAIADAVAAVLPVLGAPVLGAPVLGVQVLGAQVLGADGG